MSGSPNRSNRGNVISAAPLQLFSNNNAGALQGSSVDNQGQSPSNSPDRNSNNGDGLAMSTHGGGHSVGATASPGGIHSHGSHSSPVAEAASLGRLSPLPPSPEDNVQQFPATVPQVQEWISSLNSLLEIQDQNEFLKQAAGIMQQMKGATFVGVESNVLATFGDRTQVIANKLYEMFNNLPAPEFGHDIDTGLIDKAIEYMGYTLKLLVNESLIDQQFDYGFWHVDRSSYVFDQRLIGRGIQLLEQVLPQPPTPRSTSVNRNRALGHAYRIRYNQLGEQNDAKKMIKYMRGAVAAQHLHPTGGSFPHSILLDLGRGYKVWFNHTGDEDHAREAVETLTTALELVNDPNNKVEIMLELGIINQKWFSRYGKLKNIDAAITHGKEALAIAHNNLRIMVMKQLAGSYRMRFYRLKTEKDIEEAKQYAETAVQNSGETQKHHPLSELALVLEAQSSQKSHGSQVQISHIDSAIEKLEEAVRIATYNDVKALPECMFNLGYLYHQKFRASTQPNISDIDNAIRNKKGAAENSHGVGVQRGGLLHSLGRAYQDRFFQNEVQERDLNNCIEIYTLAIKTTPEDHPEFPIRCTDLGNAYRIQYERSLETNPNAQALNRAEFYFRKAMTSKARFALQEGLIQAAFHLAKLGQYINPSTVPFEAYKKAMEHAHNLIWIGQPIRERHKNVLQIVGLAGNAAAAAIDVQKYDQALLLLDEGLAFLWNKIFLHRTPFHKLPNQKLAHILQKMANYLSELERRNSNSELGEQGRQEQHRLAEEIEKRVAEARKYPGFEGFLKSPKLKDLLDAPQRARSTLVVFNITTRRSDILVVKTGQKIKHISLGHDVYDLLATAWDELKAVLRSHNLYDRRPLRRAQRQRPTGPTMIKICQKLWEHVVKVVVQELKYTVRKPGTRLPHMTCVTTGPLTFLPLEWSGPYDDQNPNLHDLVITSFTPTISAMNPGPPPSKNTQILAFTEPETPGQSSLPGTIDEFNNIKEQVHKINKDHGLHNPNKVMLIRGDTFKDSIASVIKAMKEHSDVHLACHASQNAQDALESGFFLTCGQLTMGDIMRQDFKNKGLAYLSACQTAMGDESMVDENQHLAAAMHLAGYRSVIGSRWPINDGDAAKVAKVVYHEALKGGKMNYAQVPYALHIATGALFKELQGKNYELENIIVRAAAFIHVGSQQ